MRRCFWDDRWNRSWAWHVLFTFILHMSWNFHLPFLVKCVLKSTLEMNERKIVQRRVSSWTKEERQIKVFMLYTYDIIPSEACLSSSKTLKYSLLSASNFAAMFLFWHLACALSRDLSLHIWVGCWPRKFILLKKRVKLNKCDMINNRCFNWFKTHI